LKKEKKQKKGEKAQIVGAQKKKQNKISARTGAED